VAGNRVLVQTAAGKAWLLDAATGKPIMEMPAPELPWRYPPLALADGHWLLAESTTRVTLREGSTGKQVWSHTIGGATILTGEPPLFRAFGDGLLLIVPTNLGYEITALDPRSGKARWPRPLLFPEIRINPNGWALDAEAFYVGKSGQLAALSMADGHQLWSRALAPPDGNWQVHLADGLLAALPAETTTTRLELRWLSGSLQWLVARPPLDVRGWCASGMLCDARTGRLVQRFQFEGGPPRSEPRLTVGDFSVLPSLRKTTTSASNGALLSCHLHPSGLVIICAGNCYGLGRACGLQRGGP
jgi:hypothetical protein